MCDHVGMGKFVFQAALSVFLHKCDGDLAPHASWHVGQSVTVLLWLRLGHRRNVH